MLHWQFKTFVAPGGRTDVQDTIDRYDVYGREAFGRAVAHLAARPISAWNKPQARKLKGGIELHEICYKADRRQARALGRFGPEPGTFTITLIATKKQDDYDPRDAFGTAARRFDQITAGTATVAPLQVNGEDFPPDDG